MLNTLIRMTRPRTPGSQRSMKPLACATGSSGPGGGSGLPVSAATFASIARKAAVRLGEPAVPGEPARAFRQGPAQEHDDRRRERPDQHHPAPALDPERRRGHEHEGEKGDDRHAGEADRLVDGEGAAAHPLRREFAHIGADRHHLEAEADAGDEPPDVEAEGVGLQRHHDVGGRVPE